LKIRPLVIEDYDELVELWREAELPYKPKGRDARERIEKELAGPCSVFLAAELDGRFVGAVLGTHDGRKGWINRVAVRPAYRRRGIARALVEAAEERLHAAGIEIVTCLIEDWNRESLAFFEGVGYSIFPGIHYLSKRKHPDV
jgi:ribosomal protein S18 acetylase RimI-like enzyme